MKTETGYKVVDTDGKQLVSAITLAGQVRYFKNKWTKRKKGNGPLAVFHRLRDAKLFALGNEYWSHGFRIYKCEYVPSKAKGLWLNKMPASQCSKGTRFADRIKLGKRSWRVRA